MEKIDLTYLKEMSAGSDELLQEMIGIYLKQVPEFVEEFNHTLHEKDWKALGNISHKAKSSALIVGLNKLGEELKLLEIDTKEQKDISTYAERIKYINETFLNSVLQFNDIA